MCFQHCFVGAGDTRTGFMCRWCATARVILVEKVAECTVDVAAALLEHFDDGATVVFAAETFLDCGYFPGSGHFYNSARRCVF